MMPFEVAMLISDVFNIIKDGGYFTVCSINLELERLGWGDQIMGEITM